MHFQRFGNMLETQLRLVILFWTEINVEKQIKLFLQFTLFRSLLMAEFTFTCSLATHLWLQFFFIIIETEFEVVWLIQIDCYFVCCVH